MNSQLARASITLNGVDHVFLVVKLTPITMVIRNRSLSKKREVIKEVVTEYFNNRWILRNSTHIVRSQTKRKNVVVQ